MKIETTTDYNRFKLHKKNRHIDYKKVQRLSAAMKKNNLLSVYPIVVDEKDFVLDGQHRFEAAKDAKVKLYFIVADKSYGIEKVAETNNFQSHWKLEDYINYYAKEGLEPYLKILELSKKYKIGPTKIVNLGDTNTVTEKIKNGTFIFDDEKFVVDLLHHAKAIGIEYAFPFWNSRPFLRALKHVVNVNGYNKMRMGQKIAANRKMLVKCHEAEEYIKLLEEIYNMKALEAVRFL
jgi:hypothetical protein